MKGINGNTVAVIQTFTTLANEIGEQVKTWSDAQSIKGWLDMMSGDSNYLAYNAKIQESTHIFVADYVPLAEGISAETARMVINGKVYDITVIDNPMEMKHGSQLEIYLKFVGGQ